MADTSLKRQLKVLTIPVFIEMALVMMLGAVDTVMLSRYSDNSVAAVGLEINSSHSYSSSTSSSRWVLPSFVHSISVQV